VRFDHPRVATWGGFVLGLVISPLVMVMLARTMTALYDGLDGNGEYGVAVLGTRDLASKLDRYRNRHQRLPSEQEGFAKLVPEFLDRVPLDPWGRPYIYEPTGPGWADVLSYGADGRAGGSGVDADVSARFGRLGSRPPGFIHPLASLVLAGLPLAAALAARRYRWCATALAGIGAFWAVLLLATVSTSMRFSFLPPLSLSIGVACLAGSIALVQELPHARFITFFSVMFAFLLLQYLVGR